MLLLKVIVILCYICIGINANRMIMEENKSVINDMNWFMDKTIPNPNKLMKMIIAVKINEVKKNIFEEVLYNVSTPDHIQYGQHWSKQQIDDYLHFPSDNKYEIILEWLTLNNIKNYEVIPGFIQFYATIEQAETLLNTKYGVYKNYINNNQLIRLQRGQTYSLPIEVGEVVDFIAPTIRLPIIHKKIQRKEKVGNGTLFVTPEWLRELYQVGDVTSKSSENSVGVAGFIGQYWSNTDLQEFYGLFSPDLKGRTIKQVGKNDPTNVGAEAELDVQYLSSMARGVDTWVWYTADQETPFLTWVLDVANSTSVPHIFSVSYGEYENGLSRAYAERINVEFMKMGVRGMSVFLASGDSGAGGNCTGDRFSPDFPASSPYVTSVGGLTGGDAGKTPTGEFVDYISGGGFSDMFSRPSYQDESVSNYLKQSGLPSTKYFNKSGRGYPDVAAQSEEFTIILDLIPIPGVGGTSCATPTTAGVFGLLNDLRLQNGKPVLGFLNPFIYKTATSVSNSFNDAVFGDNAGCEIFGFPAKQGWDAASGFGSVNYAILSKVV